MAASALHRAWRRRGWLACTLWPASFLFSLLVWLRRALYRMRLLRSGRVRVPVIVVGNVLAGGAGKTPVVIATVEHLRSAGLRPGVVSRGYGRRTRGCRQVTATTPPDQAGDEPLLVARRCAVPVFVGERRVDAARALLAAHPTTQVLVSDDGLQHLALARDIEVCVFDDRGVGNGWLLPAGPLREAWPRRVDLTLRPAAAAGIDGFRIDRRLAGDAVRADGRRVALAELRLQPCIALAGIARPEAFFDMLRHRGLTLANTIALPDHYDFNSALSNLDKGQSLVCTEKDAVKLWRYHPEAWAVALVVDIEPGFWHALDRLLAPKLSSPHGSKTA